MLGRVVVPLVHDVRRCVSIDERDAQPAVGQRRELDALAIFGLDPQDVLLVLPPLVARHRAVAAAVLEDSDVVRPQQRRLVLHLVRVRALGPLRRVPCADERAHVELDVTSAVVVVGGTFVARLVGRRRS